MGHKTNSGPWRPRCKLRPKLRNIFDFLKASYVALTVCVVTTVAGTCRTVAVAVPSVRGEPEAPGATVIPFVPATTLAAMVTTFAQVVTVRGLLAAVVVIVMV